MFSLWSEPDGTERELSERHGGLAGGEALHSLHTRCPLHRITIEGQQPEVVPFLPLQYYTVTLCTGHAPDPDTLLIPLSGRPARRETFLNHQHEQIESLGGLQDLAGSLGNNKAKILASMWASGHGQKYVDTRLSQFG